MEGYVNASSKLKYLRFITGRHDLPFYTPDYVQLQKSFLDAFLKGHDPEGWSQGKPPPVGYRVRTGDVGYNNTAAEDAYPMKKCNTWPIPGTQYVKYFLTASQGLTDTSEPSDREEKLSYDALGNLKDPKVVQFTSAPFKEEVEFTGHVVAHLNVSVTTSAGSTPSDIDLFVTLRHLDNTGKEIYYTGTVGDPVPITKGWLRCSLRAVNSSHPQHAPWHPHREYRSTDRSPLEVGKVYEVDVEIWPTNVVLQAGDKLVFEVASGDTQGAGLFEHNSKQDRDDATFKGVNHIHFGNGAQNWVLMPVVPK